MFLRIFGAAIVFSVTLFGAVASAQTETSFDVQQFSPTPHGGGFFTVESASVPRSLDVRAQLFLSYAYRPLQLVGAGNTRVAGIVDHRFDAHLLGAVSLFDRLSIGLTIPMALYQGASLTGVGGATQNLAAVAFGDLRLSPKVAILDQKRFFIDVAVLLALTLPTGNDGAFAGDRTVTFAPELDIGRRFGPVRLAFNFGYIWRERSQLLNLIVDPELYYRLGAGLDLQHFLRRVPIEIIGEIFGRTSAVTPFQRIEQNPLEWILGAKYAVLDWIILSLGFGRGFTSGYGSPAFRVFAGVTFVPIMYREPAAPEKPKAPPPDSDKDGILDEDDECPTMPEDKDGFQDKDGCPDLDNDKDGVPDSKDKCPNDDLEDHDGFEDDDGCYDADNDKDGVYDKVDKCINVPEDKDGFEDTDGCPEEDNDKDGIVDGKDKCPNEPEVVNDYEDFDGCPDKGITLVVIKEQSIDIMEKVQFETGSDKILQKSYGLLNQVSNTLKNHSEIKKIRVEGHTDDVGNDTFNLKLSQRRADSVRNYLIKQGVPADRLLAVGFGETKPISSNGTPRGKEINRRVAFSILKD